MDDSHAAGMDIDTPTQAEDAHALQNSIMMGTLLSQPGPWPMPRLAALWLQRNTEEASFCAYHQDVSIE